MRKCSYLIHTVEGVCFLEADHLCCCSLSFSTSKTFLFRNVTDGWVEKQHLTKFLTCFSYNVFLLTFLPAHALYFDRYICFLHCMFIIHVFCRSVVKLRNSFLSAMVQFELHGFYQLHKSVSVYLKLSVTSLNRSLSNHCSKLICRFFH